MAHSADRFECMHLHYVLATGSVLLDPTDSARCCASSAPKDICYTGYMVPYSPFRAAVVVGNSSY